MHCVGTSDCHKVQYWTEQRTCSLTVDALVHKCKTLRPGHAYCLGLRMMAWRIERDTSAVTSSHYTAASPFERQWVSDTIGDKPRNRGTRVHNLKASGPMNCGYTGMSYMCVEPQKRTSPAQDCLLCNVHMRSVAAWKSLFCRTWPVWCFSGSMCVGPESLGGARVRLGRCPREHACMCLCVGVQLSVHACERVDGHLETWRRKRASVN